MLPSSQKRYQDSHTRTCIQCGNKLNPASVLLSDGTFIDQQCLNLIQKSTADVSVDEDMIDFYKYILSLVMTCKKCSNIIDGTIRKNTNSNQSSNNICSLCQPKKEVSQKLQHCSSCEKEISKNLPDQSIEIEGLILCQKCYSIQCKGYNPSYNVEQKPDFGSLTSRNYLTKARKEEQGLRQRYISFKNLESMKYQPIFRREMPMFNFGSMNYHDQMPMPIPIKKKKQRIECIQCDRKKEITEFQFREQNYSVCKVCYKKNHSGKKMGVQKKEETCGFGLDLLFKEEPSISKPIQPKLIYAEKRQIQQIKIQKKTEDSHLYNLKGCKVCINAESSMINIKCRHLMMCEKCFNKEQQRQGTSQDVLTCPYCKTSGRYVPYVEPIYV